MKYYSETLDQLFNSELELFEAERQFAESKHIKQRGALKYIKNKTTNKTIIELPCNIGDTIYYLDFQGTVRQTKVYGFEIRDLDKYSSVVNIEEFGLVYLDDFNKYWFLTAEEAERQSAT